MRRIGTLLLALILALALAVPALGAEGVTWQRLSPRQWLEEGLPMAAA